MNQELVINEFIKCGRESIRQINHAMGVIEDLLEDFKTLVFAGMLSYYGREYVNDIYLAFLNMSFVTTDFHMKELIAKMYSLSDKDLKYLQRHAPGTFYDAVAVKKSFKDYRFKRTIYVSKREVDNTTLLESLVHQANHVLNSVHNPIVYNQGLNSRMGVAIEQFDGRGVVGLGLEETINQLQVIDMMKKISTFRVYKISDEKAGELLDSLFHSKPDKEEKDYILLLTISPLYQNETFQHMLINKRMSGQIDHILTEFNSKTDASYGKLLYFSDMMHLHSDIYVKKACSDTVKSLVKRYNEACNK